MIEITPIQIMAVNVIIGLIVPRIKPQGDDDSKQESTDEQINGNAIAKYFLPHFIAKTDVRDGRFLGLPDSRFVHLWQG
jgi:hypothetical protein